MICNSLRRASGALAAAWCFSLSAACATPGAAPSPARTVAAITASDVKLRDYAIADDSMMGRKAGEKGNVMMTSYLASEVARFGLQPYEVSNYARPGAESRHNLAYWRYADYAGIGPGAHGRVTLDSSLVATRRHRAPEPWAELVERQGHGSSPETVLTPAEKAREMLLMGLRLAEGIDTARFEQRTDMPLSGAIDNEVLQMALEAGYVTAAKGRLAATPDGRLRLDALLGALVR